MVQAKCIRIIKDTHGKVIRFVLADTNGHTKEVTPNKLKTDIKTGKINVINLQLKQDKYKENLNKLKIEKEKMTIYIRNAKAFGFSIKEIKTKRNRLCYLVSKSDTEHILYIPDNVYNCYMLLCSSPIKGKLKVIGASHVKDMNFMFKGCESLQSLDLSLFDTSKVTDMSFMFADCVNIESLNFSLFNTSKVTDMGYMFADCISLKSLDVSSFDTSKVKDMQCMFRRCSSLQFLDLSSFDTSNVTNMEDMFYNCNAKVKAKDTRIIKEYNKDKM